MLQHKQLTRVTKNDRWGTQQQRKKKDNPTNKVKLRLPAPN